MTELTYPKEKFKVIVIDDASTDRTGEKTKTFAKSRSFIHFVQRNKTEGGKGKPEALNYAVSMFLDTDLNFRIYLAGYKVKYVNEADCYEEAVRKWRSYWRQRSRWAKGHMQCAFSHVWPVLFSEANV